MPGRTVGAVHGLGGVHGDGRRDHGAPGLRGGDVAAHLVGGLVAVLAVLGQRLEDDRVGVARHVRVDARRRRPAPRARAGRRPRPGSRRRTAAGR